MLFHLERITFGVRACVTVCIHSRGLSRAVYSDERPASCCSTPAIFPQPITAPVAALCRTADKVKVHFNWIQGPFAYLIFAHIYPSSLIYQSNMCSAILCGRV